jgi:hypothetical protein
MERSEIAEIICDAHKRSGANCRNANIKVFTNTLAQLLNWLLVFVPVAVVLRVWPQPGNESAGVSVQWTPAISTYVNYDGQLGRDRYDSNAVIGGIRISF